MVKPLVKPNIVKKRTKPFKRHQCDRKITVKVYTVLATPSTVEQLVDVYSATFYRSPGGAPRGLTPESEESSRDVVSLCQTLVMAPIRKLGICSPMVRIHQGSQAVRHLWCFLDAYHARLLTPCRFLQICGFECQGAGVADDAQQVNTEGQAGAHC